MYKPALPMELTIALIVRSLQSIFEYKDIRFEEWAKWFDIPAQPESGEGGFIHQIVIRYPNGRPATFRVYYSSMTLFVDNEWKPGYVPVLIQGSYEDEALARAIWTIDQETMDVPQKQGCIYFERSFPGWLD